MNLRKNATVRSIAAFAAGIAAIASTNFVAGATSQALTDVDSYRSLIVIVISMPTFAYFFWLPQKHMRKVEDWVLKYEPELHEVIKQKRREQDA